MVHQLTPISLFLNSHDQESLTQATKDSALQWKFKKPQATPLAQISLYGLSAVEINTQAIAAKILNPSNASQEQLV